MIFRVLSLLVLAVAFALPAWAKPSVSSAISPEGWRVHTIKFDSSTDDSDAFGLGPSCSVRVVTYGGSNSVSLYQVPTQSTAASSGSLVGTFSSVSTSATTFRPGQGLAKVVSTSGSDGTVMEVWCSNNDLASGGGGSTRAAACRRGDQGGGYDAATGLWDWTCGGYAGWHEAGYEIECTGVGTGTGPGSAPLVAACPFAGPTLKINAAQDVMTALVNTRRGGEVVLDASRVYLDRGCGVDEDGVDEPCASLVLDGIPLGHYIRGRIISIGGRSIVGEGGLQLTDPYSTESFEPGSTFWMIDTGSSEENFADDGVDLKQWPVMVGAAMMINRCIPDATQPWMPDVGELGSPTCDFDASAGGVVNAQRWPVSHWGNLMPDDGTSPLLQDESDMTMCLEASTVLSDGVCTNAPWIRCSNNNSVSSSNCDFSDGNPAIAGGADLGPCVAPWDLVDTLVTAGEDVNIAMQTDNVSWRDDESDPEAGSGQLLAVESVGSTCLSTGVEVTFKGEWPFSFQKLDSSTPTQMAVAWDNAIAHSEAGIRSLNFIPRHYYGVEHPDGTDCTATTASGLDDECDTKYSLGLHLSLGGGFSDFTFHRPSASGGSVLDGTLAFDQATPPRYYRDGTILNGTMIGAQMSDMSGWIAERINIINTSSVQVATGALFNAFADNGVVRDIRIQGDVNFGSVARSVAGARNFLVDGITLEGGRFPRGICSFEKGDGFDCRNIRGSTNAPLAFVAPRDGGVTPASGVRRFRVHDFDLHGTNNVGDTTGTGTEPRTRAAVIVSNNDGDSSYDNGVVQDVEVYDGTIRTAQSDVILLALSGDNTNNSQIEEDRDEISIRNVNLYTPGGAGDDSLAMGVVDIDNSTSLDADDALDPRLGSDRPRLDEVRVNGVLESGDTDKRTLIYSVQFRDTSVSNGVCFTVVNGGQSCLRQDSMYPLSESGRITRIDMLAVEDTGFLDDTSNGCDLLLRTGTGDTVDSTSDEILYGDSGDLASAGDSISIYPDIDVDAGDWFQLRMEDDNENDNCSGGSCTCQSLAVSTAVHFTPDP